MMIYDYGDYYCFYGYTHDNIDDDMSMIMMITIVVVKVVMRITIVLF